MAGFGCPPRELIAVVARARHDQDPWRLGGLCYGRASDPHHDHERRSRLVVASTLTYRATVRCAIQHTGPVIRRTRAGPADSCDEDAALAETPAFCSSASSIASAWVAQRRPYKFPLDTCTSTLTCYTKRLCFASRCRSKSAKPWPESRGKGAHGIVDSRTMVRSRPRDHTSGRHC
jgi:hypothetical protein